MRKDRYSAILMANMGARQMARALAVDSYEGAAGGFAGAYRNKKDEERPTGHMYKGSNLFRDHVGVGNWYGAVVGRGV